MLRYAVAKAVEDLPVKARWQCLFLGVSMGGRSEKESVLSFHSWSLERPEKYP
jgi:hypothetical protein